MMEREFYRRNRSHDSKEFSKGPLIINFAVWE